MLGALSETEIWKPLGMVDAAAEAPAGMMAATLARTATKAKTVRTNPRCGDIPSLVGVPGEGRSTDPAHGSTGTPAHRAVALAGTIPTWREGECSGCW